MLYLGWPKSTSFVKSCNLFGNIWKKLFEMAGPRDSIVAQGHLDMSVPSFMSIELMV